MKAVIDGLSSFSIHGPFQNGHENPDTPKSKPIDVHQPGYLLIPSCFVMNTFPTSSEFLAEKYDRPVPRYTSYPTAVQFSDQITYQTINAWLTGLDHKAAVSVYLHLPFCPSLCWYCGCNMRVTHSETLMQDYLAALQREIAIAASRLQHRLDISTIHLGGGTPTYYRPDDLKRLFSAIGTHFDILPGAEVSVEIDPRRFDAPLARALGDIGITRASLGVQDTNPAVQQAIGRIQPLEQTAAAFSLLRDAGIKAINADLIYGLPLQTTESIQQTARDVASLGASRIALYGYAHVPWMKPHQRLLEKNPIPGAVERLRLFNAAARVFHSGGYQAVGIDHFAHKRDALAKAAAKGTMNRNFMGYTTDSSPTILGFGVSSISSYPVGYSQNTTSIKDYLHQMKDERLPVWKGYRLTRKDICAARIITSIMCRLEVDVAGIAQEHGFPPTALVANAQNLMQMRTDGLIEGDINGTIRVTSLGRPFTRILASCFDAYMKPSTQRHSRL
ncbi:oxygen-independent coproporphyrinogen III oxidase [Hyphomicrobium zavarzinii]|uniref:oxygen-independent coproporphyrinogen III oxidase n=1 Tax=Hyphomicrobium zavarzinii TaxID=48292 RepID=UPI0018DD659D|nr:oxygen-independent coproporphyrinogen III oxidase [Hyphomicrobium zavarzinii]